MRIQSRHISTLPSISSTPSTNSSQTLTPTTPTTNCSSATQGTPTIPIKIYRTLNKSLSHCKNVLQKPEVGSYKPSPIMKRLNETSSNYQSSSITLDSIVKEYLRKQHALCKNPVVICPPFDLFTPHRCPEPLNRNAAPLNMTVRLQKRQILPPFGGMFGTNLDRRFIYSKFRPIRTYRDSEGSSSFTSCAFSHVDQFLFLGTVTGGHGRLQSAHRSLGSQLHLPRL